MDRDPLAERDVAADLIAGDRVAAFASRTSTSSTPGTAIPTVCEATVLRAFGFRGRVSSSATSEVFSLCRTFVTTCDLQLPRAEREIEVLGLLEVHLPDHAGEKRRAGDLAVREVVLLQGLLERVPAVLLGVLARLPAPPLADLVTRARR